MPWHTPITWQVDQLVTETHLNAQIRDNMDYLKERVDSPASAQYTANETSDYSTSSTTFVDVDATNLAFTLTTKGNAVMLGFYGTVNTATASDIYIYFDVLVDGVRRAGDDGMVLVARKGGSGFALGTDSVAFVHLIPSLSAGSHTFKLQWKVSGGSATLRAGAGTATVDLHPQFWAREVS
jgi:hypothetical protein